MSTRHITTRREFISSTALGFLIGNAFKPGTGLAQSITTPNADRYQSVTLTTHEWQGDIEERLDLPKEWDVNVHYMAGHDSPVLSKQEITQQIRNPIGTRPLREIAAGKKTASILFDDMTRATPAGEIAPILIEELRAAGIKDEHILFIAMVGSHNPLDDWEVRAKLGDYIVDNFPWVNHNCFNNLTDVGRTETGNHISINTFFMKSDVKIAISGIKAHWGPGYSGGAKAILPGVANVEAIGYNHGPVRLRNPSSKTGKIYDNDCRKDMIGAARLAGLDFTVQLVLNGKRKIIRAYAGDVVDAYEQAVIDANKLYETRVAQNVDVVITNAYPRNLQERGGGFTNQSLRSGGTHVIIWQSPLGRSPIHYHGDRNSENVTSYWERLRGSDPDRTAGQVLIFSQYVHYRDVVVFKRGKYHMVKTWEDALAFLTKYHGESTKAAVYPYVGVQHPPLSLHG